MPGRDKPRMPVWMAHVIAVLIILVGLAAIVGLAILGVGLVA